MSADYDRSSAESIFHFAKKLTGRSLSEVVVLPPEITNKKNRGDLGSLVEKYFFENEPPNNSGPDFPDAGLELKTTGVVRNSKGEIKAKERLVLTMINYTSILEESWHNSSFLEKCKYMLIMFYLYDKSLSVTERKFILDPLIYKIPENDLKIIKQDWEFIKHKISEGKAHELSEGDTFYLGACRKGSGGDKERLIEYPASKTKAKSRAFAFKQTYVNSLITSHITENPVFELGVTETLEDATYRKFETYIGRSIDEIAKKFDYFKKGKNHKGYKYELALRIISGKGNKIPELEKANIEIKTISLNPKGLPREHMSFPGFRFMEIINEDWEDSKFFEKIEKKFLFVVFQIDSLGVERLVKVGYWNMPFEDRIEAEKVWSRTKKMVSIDCTKLPAASESRVAHVRPKAKDGKDKIITPQGILHVKQCFWLNREYIHSVINSI